jgi:hypothetical protein
MKKAVLVVLATGFLSGCMASTSVVTDVHGNVVNKQRDYLDAQIAALEAQKPIFEMEAQPGESIQLINVKSIRVYGPNSAISEIKPYVSPGYKLAERAMETLLFPLVSWGMLRESLRATRPIVTPYERSTVDPFERSVVDPFVRPSAP